MPLFKSPAGVPWKVGSAEMIEREMALYTDAMVNLWLQDEEKMAWAAAHGWQGDEKAVFKVVALGLWEEARATLLAKNASPRHSVREIASMDAVVERDLRQLPHHAWVAWNERVGTADGLRPGGAE